MDGEIDRPAKKLKLARRFSHTHIDPNKGILLVDQLSPVVVMKKIKLGPSGFADVTDLLPELTEAEENQDLESQRVQNKTQSVQNKDDSLINTMTQDELNDHVQQCLEMSLENKINTKNAFALKLIDCFSFLQKKKDFSAMACTLDAGTKIYSCRVDALHQQVMKLADEVIKNTKQKKTQKEDADDENLPAGKKFKKASRNKFIASSETLNRKMKTKDPRDKYMRLEALPGAILSAARRDAKDLSLTLERSTPFWPNWENYKPLKAEGVVSLPYIKIVREKPQILTAETSPRFPEVYQHPTDVEPSVDTDLIFQETPLSQECVSLVDFPVSDPDSGNDGDNRIVIDDAEEPVSEPSILDEGEADVVSTVMDRLRQEAEAEGAVSRAPTRVEALKILLDLSSEYDYLQKKNCNYWAGPEFWKRPQGITESGKEKIKVTNKKKEPAAIEYDFKDLDERLAELRNPITRLTDRTVRSWNYKKTTLPTDLNIDSACFLNLFNVESSGLASKEFANEHRNPPNFVDVSDKVEEAENITNTSTDPFSSEHEDTRSSQDPVNATFYEAASGQSVNSEPRDPLDCTFYDAGPSNKDLGKIIRVEVSSSNNPDFGDSSMVPMPKTVKVNPIKYSTRPIRVNMQHLKQAMLDVIKERIENKSLDNTTQSDVHDYCLAASNSEVKFKDVLKILPRKLERRTREDLSTAIAFTAVLCLANEYGLQLEKCDDGDFIVRLPDSPILPFGKYSRAESSFE